MNKSNSHQNELLIEQFKTLGTSEVPVNALGEVDRSMQTVFETYTDKYFTQKDFQEQLGKSPARINHALHRLMSNSVIERIGSKSQYFYKHV